MGSNLAGSVDSEPGQPEVVVLILCHNGREYLDDCLGSVLASDDGPIARRVVVVDNASGDGSAEHVAESFPQVDLVRAPGNLGFAGGNNFGWEHVRKSCPRADYLVLLNQDTIVASGWLRPMVDFLAARGDVASVQAKLLMHPATGVINTVGNRSHFLGFGFCGGYGEADRGQYDTPRAINYASGAAVMLRTSLLRALGLFEEGMYMYLEDAELSWRYRQLGHQVFLVPSSVVYHKYSFAARYSYYYHLEKNRYWLLGVYYKLPTLGLLAPALVLMELGQWCFALLRGALRQKARSWVFLLRPANLAATWRRRRSAQRRRKVSDREFLRDFTGSIDFAEVRTPLLKYVANPLFKGYWFLARRLIFW